MRQKINILRHISVLLLTIMIFTIGIFIGTTVEQQRVQNLYTNLQEQDLKYQNLVTEDNYLNYLISLNKTTNSNKSCNSIKSAYYTSIINLDDARLKLENYINQGDVKTIEFSRLKDHYSNLQINYWITANRINNLCVGSMNPILYFYADKKKCPACQDQGTHLDYVKSKLGDGVLIFSLDSRKEGPIKLLAQKYDISHRELPVLVINDKIYGFKTNDEIFKILNISS